MRSQWALAHVGPAGHGLVSCGRALNRGWWSLALCSLHTPLAWSAVVTAEGPPWKSRGPEWEPLVSPPDVVMTGMGLVRSGWVPDTVRWSHQDLLMDWS